MRKIMKNIIRNIFMVSLFLFNGLSMYGQCTISNLSVETGDCIEANVYSFSLNFNVAENPNNFFEIYLNGAFYGEYNLEALPLTIDGFAGASSGQDTLFICMDDTESCCADKLIESPCNCNYYNIDIEMAGCTEDSLWFDLDFDYIQVSDSFLLGTPGFYIGTYSVNELPLTVGPFPRSLTPAEILLSAQNDIFCFDSFIINDEACDQCQITSVTAIPRDCNEDGFFYVDLSFEYMNVGANGFRIRGGGQIYGDFMYEDSILQDNGLYLENVLIGPLAGDCETIYEFVVIDKENEDCSGFDVVGPICCQGACDVRDIVVDGVECNDAEHISFYLNFIYENPGNNYFQIYSGDNHVGTYLLENLPLFIESFPLGAEQTSITVCINDQEDCCDTYIFEGLDCGGEECSIYELSVSEVECNSQESIQFLLDFGYSNPGNDFYEVYANDELVGYYPLNQLPMWIEDFPIGNDQTVLTVCINDQENCCVERAFENIDCSDYGCEIGEIQYQIEFINMDSFFVALNFAHNSEDLDQFSINGTGIYYGEFYYASLPVYLGPYNCHDSLPLEYVVRDLNDAECKRVLELGIVGCPSGNVNLQYPDLELYISDQKLYIRDNEMALPQAGLRLINAFGQIILETELSGDQRLYEIEITGLPSAMYFFQITGQNLMYSGKIYKNR